MARWLLSTLIFQIEDRIVAMLLRTPGFHHGVRRIHRIIEDRKYGRDPHEPLRPGEATEEPDNPKLGSFVKHFVEELRNQARGTTDDPPRSPPSPPQPPKK